MKIYRVVPDAFVTGKKINQVSIRGLEGIYYQGGYSSFVGEMGYHNFNNLTNYIKNEGKYFYLFAEDAICQASSLIGGYHKLNMDTCLVIEYDVPEEAVFKIIGYGDYTEGITPTYLIETYIDKSEFGANFFSTDELSTDEKNKILVKCLNESLKRMIECESIFDIIAYKKYLNDKKIESLIDNDQEIFDVLLNSNFYKAFFSQTREISKSPYITGKIVPININFWNIKLKNYDQISEYYQSKGFECDFTAEHTKEKEEIIYNLDSEENKQHAITLLRQMKK